MQSSPIDILGHGADHPPGFDQAFRRELARIRLDRARLLHVWVPVLYAAFWFLDLLLQPQWAWVFLGIRLTVCGLFVIGLLLLYSRYAEQLSTAAPFVNALACAGGIAVMSMLLGGFSSIYFVGIMVVLFVLAVLMPWSPQTALVNGTLITAGYGALNIWKYGPSQEMIAPLFFIAGAVIFSVLTSHALQRTIERDFSLRLQLEKANADLLELDEAKTNFFANVSHELRTPLTLILGPIETLRSELKSDHHADLLAAMRTNANQLLRQVDALLDISKLEAGSMRLETDRGNLGELLSTIAESAKPAAEREGIELIVEGVNDLPESYFDWDKVWVIAGNLVSNALKFTEQGSIRVTAEEGSDNILFVVEDSGPGIPAAEATKIFDRFYQVDGSASRTHQGTGVGLALARELARLHGGDLSIDLEYHGGARFVCRLPKIPTGHPERRRAPRRRQDRFAAIRKRAMTAREYQKSLSQTVLADVESPKLKWADGDKDPNPQELTATVLVVDDTDDLRNFMASELGTSFRVLTAADGEEALEVLRSQSVDVVVSDVMMPKMDGGTLCREIRSDKSLATLPIILLTARAGSDAVVEGLEHGADDYVIKPFVTRELKARINAQLRRKNAEEQLSERDSRLVAIGRMSSSLAHDLRNALTVVKGYSELVEHIVYQDEEASNQLGPPIQQIRGAVDRLGRMTEEMLDYARGGTPQLKLVPTSLNDFFRDCIELLKGDAAQRRISLEPGIELPEACMGSVDTDALLRVLENLLTNARDALATVEGEKIVRVEAEARGRILEIRVLDNGPGIPEGKENTIFEPFHSGKSSTGLGLATVRNLVKAHGGEISVEGRGKLGGATFKLRLPVLEPESLAAPAPLEQGAQPRG